MDSQKNYKKVVAQRNNFEETLNDSDFIPRRMKKLLPLLLGATAVLAGNALAQNATTTPVGAISILIKKGSDTILAAPLGTSAEYQGTLASTATGGGSSYLLTPSGVNPAWATNQFQNLYYVRITSGSRIGMYYTIIANSNNQLTVDTAGDNLNTLAVGDTFKIYKHWTLNSLFPYNNPTLNPLTASASTAALQRKSQVMVYNSAAVGVNITPGSIYYFTAGGWLKSGTNAAANDTVIPPDVCFAVKQPSTVASDVTWVATGSVVVDPISVPVPTRSNGAQESRFGLTRAMDLPLSSSGFESGFISSPNTAALNRKDQLYVFDNSVTGFNKTPTKVYYRVGSNWIKAVSGNPIANDDIIKAGDGIMIRKAQTVDGADAILTNHPNYTIN